MICGDLNGKEIQKEGDISCTYGASQVALVVKNLPVNAGDIRHAGSIPGSGRSPEGGHGNPLTPVFLPGESYGQRSMVGYSPWGHKEEDPTEQLSTRTCLCIYIANSLCCTTESNTTL